MSLSRENQFVQEGTNKDRIPTKEQKRMTVVIKIIPQSVHGGLPFEVDGWRDVGCTQSLVSTDWAAFFGMVKDAYPILKV
jgi:hypothetical protein